MMGHAIVGVLITVGLPWTLTFYVLAAVGGLVCLLWLYNVSDRPDQHARITEKEKTHIESTLSGTISKERVIVTEYSPRTMFNQDCLFRTPFPGCT